MRIHGLRRGILRGIGGQELVSARAQASDERDTRAKVAKAEYFMIISI
jgi:hypothetical protein